MMSQLLPAHQVFCEIREQKPHGSVMDILLLHLDCTAVGRHYALFCGSPVHMCHSY